MPTESEMYELVCKDRFDSLDDKLADIYNCLKGNDGAGLTVKVDRNCQALKIIQGRWKYLLGVVGALTVGVGIRLITLLIQVIK